ncbi:hypothetical protein HZH68_005055 [Vespula germanica]|uniref:Uncharacterized protein n=2 Tax=Vespula TaxID=7451 RepID=A0A834KGZ0_VESGE|nr:hypothetical protein HZH66_004584 [Vespula vulgaris]KAF7405686.1 hypothetical protein HZH68_005055 [Vespula germanica]
MILPYSRDFHLVEVNVRDSAMGNVRPSPWATRETIQRENLEGCQCQGPVGPRATTKPVRSHVPSQHRGRRFETILMAVGCVLTAALPCPSERPIEAVTIADDRYRDFQQKEPIRGTRGSYRKAMEKTITDGLPVIPFEALGLLL